MSAAQRIGVKRVGWSMFDGIRDWWTTVSAVFGRRDRPSDRLQRMRGRWREVADHFGLTLRTDGDGVPSLFGAVGAVQVQVTLSHYDPRTIPGGARHTEFSLTSARVSPELTVARPEILSLSRASFRSGDERFDRSVALEGDELSLRAVCTADFRERLYRFVAEVDGAVRDRTFEGRWDGCDHPAERIIARLEQTVELLLETVIDPDEAWSAVAASVANEPNSDVRLELIRFVARHASDRDVGAIARRALRDRRSEVRSVAAELLGPDELSILLDVAADDDAPLAARQDALSRALAVSPPSGAADALLRIARTELPEPTIERIIRRPGEAALFARALDACAADAWPPSLMVRLVVEAAPEVRNSACAVLGRIGGVRELTALRSNSLPDDAADAVSEATARIRERLTTQRAGHLSVVEGEAGGAVSLGVAAGALAVADDDETG